MSLREGTRVAKPCRLAMFFAVLAITGLIGCAVRPAESVKYRSALPEEAIDPRSADVIPIENLDDIGDDGALEILALSSGGAWGAFGAGVLTGWSERGTRPEFDIVTGVSTGALMSVFAFLGPNYDPLLQQLYTEVETADIYTDRGAIGFLSDSLYDNTPLMRAIEDTITPEVLAAVAREHAKGRRLYVGSTNLDSGDLIVWDMGAIASGDRADPALHFRKVLRASATVPVYFRPVYIKPQRGVQLRQAHVDGGLKAPVLLSDFLFRVEADERNLYVIVNDILSERNAYAAVSPDLADIAQKSISTMLRQLLIQTVYRGYARAVNSKTDFHLASVPETFIGEGAALTFDPDTMRRLFDAGRTLVTSADPWRSAPPNIQSFDVMDH